jgi:hypothetical protein
MKIEDYNYAFRIEGSKGIAILSNALLVYSVGDQY